MWNWLQRPARPAFCGHFPSPKARRKAHLPDGKFVLASPLAGWGSKQWPLEFYEELARRLDLPLVVNGPPEAAATLARIRGAHVHLSGIRGLIHATRRAHAVIGVDSGPMHLAAALAKPGVAIFGPTDPARNGPYGGSLRVVAQRRRVDHLQAHRARWRYARHYAGRGGRSAGGGDVSRVSLA